MRSSSASIAGVASTLLRVRSSSASRLALASTLCSSGLLAMIAGGPVQGPESAQPQTTQTTPATPPAPIDAAELAARLRRAHGLDSGRQKTDRFAAQLQISPTARDEEQVRVSLDVRFWNRRAADAKKRDLIRYKVDEQGKLLERGRDKRGLWTRTGAEVISLGGRDHQSTREQVLRELRLARQVLEFLDPAAIIAKLRDASPVEERDLKVGRRPGIPCRTLTGTVDTFPLYHAVGEGRRARLTLFVEAETDRLYAVEVYPLNEAGLPEAQGEFVLLLDHRDQAGLLLPTKLTILRARPGRAPTAEEGSVEVLLTSIELAPALDEAAFDRNQKFK